MWCLLLLSFVWRKEMKEHAGKEMRRGIQTSQGAIVRRKRKEGEEEEEKVWRRLIKWEKARLSREMGEMPQAAERRDNCHMQSLRGCVCVRVCVCINHSTSVHCYYLSEQGNLPPSALRVSINPTAASLQGLDPSWKTMGSCTTASKHILQSFPAGWYGNKNCLRLYARQNKCTVMHEFKRNCISGLRENRNPENWIVIFFF